MINVRRLVVSSLIFTVNALNPAIAFADNPGLPTKLPAMPRSAASGPVESDLPGIEAPSATSAVQTADATPSQATAAPAAPASERFNATGAAFTLASGGFTITPPAGWDVETNTGSLSMVMREQRDEKPDYDKPKYQRNVTIAAMHHASPIDEKRATEFQADLTKNFSGNSSVSDFQILEHKFFNYRGTNDGLLVYTSLRIGEYPMMQMHVLVSGAEKQFLMTYTDLAERFSSKEDKGFETAWNTMVGIEVSGLTPSREDEYLRYGAMAGGVFMTFLVFLVIRRKAGKKDYASEADELDSYGDAEGASTSMFATLAQGWRIDGKSDGAPEADDLQFSQYSQLNDLSSGLSRSAAKVKPANKVAKAARPETLATEYVSSF